MRRAILSILMSAVVVAGLSAQSFSRVRDKKPTYNEQIVKQYTDTLAFIKAVDSIRQAMESEETVLNNPYYYPLLLTPTLYDTPIRDVMESTWKPSRVDSLPRLLPSAYNTFSDSVRQNMTDVMMWAYTNVPWLVGNTQKDLDNASAIRKEIVEQPVKEVTHITPQREEVVDLGMEDASYKVQTRRPNFWKFSGSFRFNMSQNYVTSNWYQGDMRNNAFTLYTELNANYNNQKWLSVTNNLVCNLGFTSQHKDKNHKYATNTDQLRLTSNMGINAVKNWAYSLQLQVRTQSFPKYASNSDRVTSDFLSPVEGNLSIGMRYSVDWKNKKKATVVHFDVNIAPLSYHAIYCDRKALRSNNGIPGKHHAYNDFGPNITSNYTWNICKNVYTKGNINYYSNYHYIKVYYTSTTGFTINKYLSTTLIMNLRYEDTRMVNGKEEYLQFQENWGMGLSLSF